MRCYCIEIAKITSDLKILRTMKAKLISIQGYNQAQNSTCAQLATALPTAVTPGNIGVLTQKVRELTKNTKNVISDAESRVIDEINALEDKLSMLQKTDANYHKKISEEKEKKLAEKRNS